MNKEDIEEKLNLLLPKMQHYAQFKEVTLEPIERDAMIALMPVVAPNYRFNAFCGSCGGEALMYLYSYWQREIAL